MRTSNLKKLIELAHIYNHAYAYREMGYGFLAHPYLQHRVIVVDGKMIHVDKNNYEQALKEVDKQIDASRSVFSVFFNMRQPYQLQFLDLAKRYLSKKDFSEQLKSIWMMTEFPHQYPNTQLVNLFKISDKKSLMQSDELKKFKALQDNITVYRGVWGTKYSVKGLSWTLDKDKARWFSKRFKPHGKVIEAEISKRDVFAYFTGRSEEEVVVNPNRLRKVKTYVM